jgi:acyl-coenzyme A synthetase/AMP-(fatty) acid ligase
VARVAALVVAPMLDEPTILDALRAGVDPAFLPRPLRKVAALPRNETGKLPRAQLLALLRRRSN